MSIGIYSILDRSAELFGRPFFSTGDQSAVRAFRAECKRDDPANMMFMYAQDFTLYKLGEFDEHTGEVVSLPLRELANGLSIE